VHARLVAVVEDALVGVGAAEQRELVVGPQERVQRVPGQALDVRTECRLTPSQLLPRQEGRERHHLQDTAETDRLATALELCNSTP
jgi:hypothetical protein